MKPQFHWNARPYFKALTERNILARQLGLVYCDVSGLQGFEDVLTNLLNAPGFIALADSSDGLANIDNTPNVRRVKTIFLGLRHAADDPDARNLALDRLRELFRQILSHLLREKNRLQTQGIYLDPEITFTEIDSYFATGTACAYFQIAYSTSFNLAYSQGLWSDGSLWLVNSKISLDKLNPGNIGMLFAPLRLNITEVIHEIKQNGLPYRIKEFFTEQDSESNFLKLYHSGFADTYDFRILPHGQIPETQIEKLQLWLISYPAANKLQVIKVVRSITGLGLADAKALVENAPSLILEDYRTSLADDPLGQLTEAGAVTELR